MNDILDNSNFPRVFFVVYRLSCRKARKNSKCPKNRAGPCLFYISFPLENKTLKDWTKQFWEIFQFRINQTTIWDIQEINLVVIAKEFVQFFQAWSRTRTWLFCNANGFFLFVIQSLCGACNKLEFVSYILCRKIMLNFSNDEYLKIFRNFYIWLWKDCVQCSMFINTRNFESK